MPGMENVTILKSFYAKFNNFFLNSVLREKVESLLLLPVSLELSLMKHLCKNFES